MGVDGLKGTQILYLKEIASVSKEPREEDKILRTQVLEAWRRGPAEGTGTRPQCLAETEASEA